MSDEKRIYIMTDCHLKAPEWNLTNSISGNEERHKEMCVKTEKKKELFVKRWKCHKAPERDALNRHTVSLCVNFICLLFD